MWLKSMVGSSKFMVECHKCTQPTGAMEVWYECIGDGEKFNARLGLLYMPFSLACTNNSVWIHLHR